MKHTAYAWRALGHFRRVGVGMIHVPKSAGTSMASVLFGRSLGHFTFSEYTQSLGPAARLSPPLFAVIREPEERFLSAYRFFRQGQTNDAGIELQHPSTPVWKEDLDRFLDEYIETTPDRQRDYVFQSQSRFVAERLNRTPQLALFRLDDLNTAQVWLSNQLQQHIEFPHKNRTATDYHLHLSDAQRARIQSIYQADFELYETLKNHSHHP